MMYYYNGFDVLTMILFIVGLVVMVGLIVLLLYLWSKNKGRAPHYPIRTQHERNEDYIHELKRSFAQGKIDEEEYLKRKKILESDDYGE